jgi:soluble lytic murein transglycosylase
VKPRLIAFLFLAGLLLLGIFGYRWWIDRIEYSQDKNIREASRKHGVDPALIKAVIWRESKFDPAARGTKGETGLMQIMDLTGLEWAGEARVPGYSPETLVDPARNIDCGTWYLKKLLGRYRMTDDPVPFALADYNAGRGNVLKWMKGAGTTNSAAFIEQIGFPSTRHYVRTVVARRAKYARQLGTP